MSVINRDKLPFVGMSHEFVGEKHGVSVSFFMVNAPPGRGPALHRHNYDEIIIVEEGSATCVAGNEQREVKAGDIIVIPAGTPHRFVNSGNSPLRQIDTHAHPTFVTEFGRKGEELAEQLISSAVSHRKVNTPFLGGTRRGESGTRGVSV